MPKTRAVSFIVIFIIIARGNLSSYSSLSLLLLFFLVGGVGEFVSVRRNTFIILQSFPQSEGGIQRRSFVEAGRKTDIIPNGSSIIRSEDEDEERKCKYSSLHPHMRNFSSKSRFANCDGRWLSLEFAIWQIEFDQGRRKFLPVGVVVVATL